MLDKIEPIGGGNILITIGHYVPAILYISDIAHTDNNTLR